MDEIDKISDPVRAGMMETTSGKTVTADMPTGAPEPINSETGMHGDYYVLSKEERAKGFIRPLRDKYIHVGIPGPEFPLRDLTPEEIERWGSYGYVKFEPYPEGYHGSATGTFWTQDQLDKVGKGCQTETRMQDKGLVETYARNPRFYGATFCCGCGKHLRVGKKGEFVWKGTTERVGT